MNREEKSMMIEEISARLKRAEIAVLAENAGLTVAEITGLRHSLREIGAEVKVVKNTLAKRAIQDTEFSILKDYFNGPVTLITATDPIAPAKILTKFATDLEKFKIKAGILSGKLLNGKDVEALSKLPSREQLLSSMLGSLKAPAQNLVGVLAALPRNLVGVLAAIRDKKKSS